MLDASIPSTLREGMTPAKPSKGTVLVVEDELAVLRVYARALGADGFRVLTAADGDAAELIFRQVRVDAVVSDVTMPGLDGIDLVRSIHRIDGAVPVILATGDPGDERACKAVAAGALMYLVKPVDLRALGQIISHAIRTRHHAALANAERDPAAASHDGLTTRFDAALRQIWVAYQPIVASASRLVVGYEALARSEEPSLSAPIALFDAAALLGRTWELGRAIRARVAAAIPEAPPGARIFVNLHASELLDAELYAADAPLQAHAGRVVLEITERDSLHCVPDIEQRLDRLRASGFRVAVDDLGAGYAGLASFAKLQPSVVKLDAALIRGIDKRPTNGQIVRSMALLCKDMDVELIAEGVETEDERRTLGDLGCNLHQGFLYARPARGFAALAA